MNISLTPELAQFVQDLVQTGMYHSSSEVIRDGLRLLREREQLRQIRIGELRKELAIGLEQLERGEVAPLDIEAVKAEGRRLLCRARDLQCWSGGPMMAAILRTPQANVDLTEIWCYIANDGPRRRIGFWMRSTRSAKRWFGSRGWARLATVSRRDCVFSRWTAM